MVKSLSFEQDKVQLELYLTKQWFSVIATGYILFRKLSRIEFPLKYLQALEVYNTLKMEKGRMRMIVISFLSIMPSWQRLTFSTTIIIHLNIFFFYILLQISLICNCL